MAEEQVNQEDKPAFTRGGSALNNISLSQAGVLAIRTAQANPGRRRWILRRRMLFEVLSDHEDDDRYTVVVSFRPEEDFEGTPGQERFKFSKIGRFEDREILNHPKSSKRFRIKRKTVVVGAVGILVLIGFAVLILVLESGVLCASFYCDEVGALPHIDSVVGSGLDAGSNILARSWVGRGDLASIA